MYYITAIHLQGEWLFFNVLCETQFKNETTNAIEVGPQSNNMPPSGFYTCHLIHCRFMKNYDEVITD